MRSNYHPHKGVVNGQRTACTTSCVDGCIIHKYSVCEELDLSVYLFHYLSNVFKHKNSETRMYLNRLYTHLKLLNYNKMIRLIRMSFFCEMFEMITFRVCRKLLTSKLFCIPHQNSSVFAGFTDNYIHSLIS